MAITPNDINNREFKKNFRGYDIDEVDEFLEEIVDDYEKLFKENLILKEKVMALEEKINHYANMESTLQNTLLLAQTAADQAKENSKKDAELIIRQAQETANKIIRDANDNVLNINKEAEVLVKEYSMFKSRFKALLEAQLKEVDRFKAEDEVV